MGFRLQPQAGVAALSLLLLFACGHPAPPFVPKDSRLQLDRPACELQSARTFLPYSLILRWGNRPFASVGGEVTDLDLRLRSGGPDGVALVSVTRDGITLRGEVLTSNVGIRPKAPTLVQEWLNPFAAPLGSVQYDGTLQATPDVPSLLKPNGTPTIELGCAYATVGLDAEMTKLDGEVRFLKPDASSPLRLTPDGLPFGALSIPPGTTTRAAELEVRVLETQGPQVKVRFGLKHARSAAFAWIDARALEPEDDGPQLFGASIQLVPKPPVGSRRCTKDVDILVHDGPDHFVTVGRVAANTPFSLLENRTGEVPIDLRLVPRDGTSTAYEIQDEFGSRAFVRQIDIDDCETL